MAPVYKRGKIRWIKFYPPGKSEPTRQSLGAVDPAWAELIRRKLELELELELELHLRTPELRQVELPGNVLETLGDPPAAPPPQIPPPLPFPAEPAFVPEAPVARTSPPVREVLGEYLAHIEVENSSHHVKNKISYLKKFFGSELLGAKEPCKGVFLGETLEDVRAAH